VIRQLDSRSQLGAQASRLRGALPGTQQGRAQALRRPQQGSGGAPAPPPPAAPTLLRCSCWSLHSPHWQWTSVLATDATWPPSSTPSLLLPAHCT
jgi:hypothetical protein